MARDRLEDLDEEELSSVTGGRISNPNAKPDPVTLQMIQKLTESVQAIGQSMVQGKQASQQQMMQVMQQMGGGAEGKKHA
jgi:hypothetical protein